jgi:hypothetical protein
MKSRVFLEFFKIFFQPQNAANVLINYEGPKITTDYRVGLPIMPKDGCGQPVPNTSTHGFKANRS